MALKNIIGQKTTTTGAIGVAATISLDGAALSAHNTFAGGGAVSGTAYSVAIKDGSARQVGVATYTSGSPGTLTIDSILASTNGGSAITLSGDAEVYVDALAEDLAGGVSAFDVQVFTSSGTYTPTAGAKFIKVICTAGGQGGDDVTGSSPGYGGAAGQTAIRYLSAAEFGSSQTVTIGAGGAADLGDGGETSFGTLVVAKPGTNSGSVGDITFGGEKSPPVHPDTTATGVYSGGPGGASYWGGYNNSAPTNPFGTGGEGGGFIDGTSYGSVAGNPGVCVVEEYA